MSFFLSGSEALQILLTINVTFFGNSVTVLSVKQAVITLYIVRENYGSLQLLTADIGRVTGDCTQDERWTTRSGDCGVRLGIHGAYSCTGQHVAQWAGSTLWTAEHWWSNHIHQWSVSGGASSFCMSDLCQGRTLLSCLVSSTAGVYTLSLFVFFLSPPPSFPLPLCLDREVACASNVASCGWTRMTFIKINIKHFWKTTRRSLNEMHFR